MAHTARGPESRKPEAGVCPTSCILYLVSYILYLVRVRVRLSSILPYLGVQKAKPPSFSLSSEARNQFLIPPLEPIPTPTTDSTTKMMEYFTHKKAKKAVDMAERDEKPVLNDEDEAFLQRIASEGTPPPLPERPQSLPVAGETHGNNAQIALMAGAQNIPLPDVPDTPDDVIPVLEGEEEETVKGKQKESKGKRPFSWSFLRRDSRDSKRKSKDVMATDLLSVAEGLKGPDAQPNEDGIVTPHEAAKEEDEMTRALESLNLAAVNNRVFSISKESQELLHKYGYI